VRYGLVFDHLLSVLRSCSAMSGPIVRTGPTPQFSANWENVFGKKSGSKSAAPKSAKAAKPAKSAKAKAAKPAKKAKKKKAGK
jgi:hypothetical protein